MIIKMLIQGIEILIGVLQLALVLRALLPWLKVSPAHPVMRFLEAVTDPVVRPVRQALGNRSYRGTGGGYVDIAPLVAFFVLWLAQIVLTRLLYLIAVPPTWLLHPADDPATWIIGILNFLFQVYDLMLLVRILLEWVQVSYSHPVMRFLWDATEPLLGPIRRRLPLLAGLDFSPLAAVLLLSVVQMFLTAVIQMVL